MQFMSNGRRRPTHSTCTIKHLLLTPAHLHHTLWDAEALSFYCCHKCVTIAGVHKHRLRGGLQEDEAHVG